MATHILGRCAPIAAVLVIGGTAIAQVRDPAGLDIVLGTDTLGPGESTTIRLDANFDSIRDHAVAGVATWLDSSAGALGLSDIRVVEPMDGPGTSAGMIGDRGVRGIIAGQLLFVGAGIFPDPSDPIAFWEATFTAPDVVDTPFDVDLETRTSRFDVYISMDSSTSESRLDGFQEGTATIRVVPAPASGLVLAMALGLAGRRRRG
ncbi:MAG: hypothetical protein AAFX79_02235 [Planctomycetota bacterium]